MSIPKLRVTQDPQVADLRQVVKDAMPPILDLPPELRCMIFKEVLRGDPEAPIGTSGLRRRTHQKSTARLSVLFVNRLFYAEACPIFYSSQVFHLDMLQGFLNCVASEFFWHLSQYQAGIKEFAMRITNKNARAITVLSISTESILEAIPSLVKGGNLDVIKLLIDGVQEAFPNIRSIILQPPSLWAMVYKEEGKLWNDVMFLSFDYLMVSFQYLQNIVMLPIRRKKGGIGRQLKERIESSNKRIHALEQRVNSDIKFRRKLGL